MNKISLYKINICIFRSIISYGKSIGVDRSATPRTRNENTLRQDALYPYALPLCSGEDFPFFSLLCMSFFSHFCHNTIDLYILRYLGICRYHHIVSNMHARPNLNLVSKPNIVANYDFSFGLQFAFCGAISASSSLNLAATP